MQQNVRKKLNKAAGVHAHTLAEALNEICGMRWENLLVQHPIQNNKGNNNKSGEGKIYSAQRISKQMERTRNNQQMCNKHRVAESVESRMRGITQAPACFWKLRVTEKMQTANNQQPSRRFIKKCKWKAKKAKNAK